VESRMVTEIFEKFCLSRLDVHFVLVRDQQVVYDLVASDLLERVKAIFPDVPVQSLKSFEVEHKDMQLRGCLSLNTFAKRRMVICFVNDRFVVNQTLTSAVYAAYSDMLEKGKHPFVVLKLSLNPRNTDVNVHPQKLEVKFVNEEDVFKFVRDSLRRLLAKPIVRQIHVQERPRVAEPVEFYRPSVQPEKIEEVEERLLEGEKLRFVGTVRGRYVLFEKDEGLVILDFHAAHERIVFEQMMNSLAKRNNKTLIVAMRIRMKETDAALLASSQVLKELGFALSVGDEGLIVEQIPDWMELSEVEEFLRESVDELKLVDLQGMRETIKKILADHACKKSMRTRDRVSEIEMKELAEKIVSEGYSTCPHGRPLMFSIGFRDLDRFFGRD